MCTGLSTYRSSGDSPYTIPSSTIIGVSLEVKYSPNLSVLLDSVTTPWIGLLGAQVNKDENTSWASWRSIVNSQSHTSNRHARPDSIPYQRSRNHVLQARITSKPAAQSTCWLGTPYKLSVSNRTRKAGLPVTS